MATQVDLSDHTTEHHAQIFQSHNDRISHLEHVLDTHTFHSPKTKPSKLDLLEKHVARLNRVTEVNLGGHSPRLDDMETRIGDLEDRFIRWEQGRG